MQLKIPPAIQVLIALGAMWLISANLPAWSFAFWGKNTWAILLTLAGVFMAVSAVGAFRKSGTTVNPMTPAEASELVVTGLYRYSRNPMYLAMALILAGWALLLGNWLNFGVLALFIWVITEWQIKPEEKALSERFGGQYETYRKQVRRWI